MENKQIKELIKIVSTSDINTFKMKNKDFSIQISKTSKIQKTQTQYQENTQVQIIPEITESTLSKENEETDNNSNLETLNSPMVGTFYNAPSPKSPPFVKVGDTVSKGNIIGIIEAMKVMNEVEAEFDCKIVKIIATDEQPVEFNMPLFRVEKI